LVDHIRQITLVDPIIIGSRCWVPLVGSLVVGSCQCVAAVVLNPANAAIACALVSTLSASFLPPYRGAFGALMPTCMRYVELQTLD